MHYERMTSHTDIVKRAGKAEAIAIARGVSPHTVRSWALRDSIPAEHWAWFASEGHATLEELAAVAAARAPQAA